MDIAKLGIAIDPTQSQEGARRVKEALTQMGQAAKNELGKIDAATNRNATGLKTTASAASKAGREINQAGQNARAGFVEMGRGMMDVLDAVGLLNNGFGSMLRRTDSAIRGGQAMNTMMGGMAARSGAAAAGASNLSGSIAATGVAAGSTLGKFAPLLLAITGIAAAFLGAVAAGALLVGVFKGISAAIPEAAKMENLRVRLAVAVGSFTEADKKFKELKKFADETPFSDEEVFKAGVALQSMTDGALSGIPQLTAIGGAASQAGDNFAVMAERVGQVYNGIKNGGDFIEQLKTLSNQGVVSGATLGAVKALNAELEAGGNSGQIRAKQWAMIYADLEAKSVALVLQSRTWSGLLSTIDGSWQSLKAAFAAPIIDALKPVLVQIIALFPAMIDEARRVGATLADGMKIAYQAIKNGQFGTLLSLSLQAGISQAFDAMGSYAAGKWESIKAGVNEALWIGGTLAITAIGKLAISIATGVVQTVHAITISVLSLAMKAVVLVLSLGLVNAFNTGNQEFSTKGSKAAGYIGTALFNAIGQAFEDTINAFVLGMRDAAIRVGADLTIALAKAIPGGMALLQSIVPAPAPEPDPATFVGPPRSAIPQGFDMFTPLELPPISDIFNEDGGVLPPKTGASPQAQFNTFKNDFLTEFNSQNAGFKNEDLGPQFKPEPFVPDPTVGAPKAKAVKDISDSLDKATPKVEEFRSAMGDLTNQWGDFASQADQTMANVAQSLSANITGGLTDLITGTKDAKQAFADMANAIIGDITQMILQMTIQLALSKALGGVGGGIGGGGGIVAGIAHSGGVVGSLSNTSLPTYHAGGVVQTTRQLSLPKFHAGGASSSEQVVKVDRGETILTRRRASELEQELRSKRGDDRRGNQGSQTATIINVLDRNEISDAVARSPGAVVNALSRNLPMVRKMVLSGQRP